MQDATRPWLSIVTVVKDDVDGFRTDGGLPPAQDRDGVEWVVIDSSADLDQIRAAIGAAALTAEYHWTTPAGVYPAMNAGLAEANGDYVLFLNAGDTLAADDTATVIRRALTSSPVWMYGQVTFVTSDGRRVTPPAFDYAREKASLFARGRFPPHQGTVARTSTLRDLGGFDVGYRITADYAAFLRLSLVADPVEVAEVLAVFTEGGLSTVAWQESLREFHRARTEVLRPKGAAALRERLATTVQWAQMAVARGLGRSGA